MFTVQRFGIALYYLMIISFILTWYIINLYETCYKHDLLSQCNSVQSQGFFTGHKTTTHNWMKRSVNRQKGNLLANVLLTKQYVLHLQNHCVQTYIKVYIISFQHLYNSNRKCITLYLGVTNQLTHRIYCIRNLSNFVVHKQLVSSMCVNSAKLVKRVYMNIMH